MMQHTRFVRHFCSISRASTKSIKSIPSIPSHLFGIKTEENNFPVSERLDKDILRYNENRSHDSGMISACPIGLNETWLLPTQSSTLKQLFKHDMNGKIHTKWYPHHVALTGTGMNTVNDDAHRRQRKIFQPFFNDEALEGRYSVIKKFTQDFIYKISEINDYTNIFQHSQRWAFDNVLGFIFDEQIYDEKEAQILMPLFKRYSSGFSDFNIENINKPDTILGDAMIARQQLLDRIEILVNKSKDLYDKSQLSNKTIIYRMIHSIQIVDNNTNINDFKPNEMTLNEFMDNLLLHVWAGHDTTASTTCNGIYYLKHYGEQLMEQLRNEYDNDTNIINDYNYIQSHVELDAFVKEIVRILPTVPSVPKLFAAD
eukprot:55049_1